MPLFRGTGGSGDASTDAYASQVATSAQTATTLSLIHISEPTRPY